MPRGGGYDVTGLAVKVTREGVTETSKDLKDLATSADKADKEVDQLGKGSKEASRNVKSLGDHADKAAGGIKGMLGVAAGLTAAYVAFSKVSDMISASINAAAEQQKVFAGLDIALANAGVSYRSLSGELDTYFAKLQATTVYGDTDSAEALRFLTVVTGDYGSAMKLLEPTLEFSAALHIDIATAARLAGQAATGMTGTLSRYGIILDDTTKKQLEMASASEKATIIAEMLQGKFGGSAAAELETYGGGLQQLGNYWGDLTEAIGDWFVKSEAAPALFAELTDAIQWMIGVANTLGDAFTYMQETGDFSDVADSVRMLKEALSGFGVGIDTDNVKVIWAFFSFIVAEQVSSKIENFAKVINALDGGLERMAALGPSVATFSEGLVEGFNRSTDATWDLVASHETLDERLARINQAVAANLSAINGHKKALDGMAGSANNAAVALDPFLAEMAALEETSKRGGDWLEQMTTILDDLAKGTKEASGEIEDMSGAMDELQGLAVGPFQQLEDDAIDSFANIESAFSSMLQKGFTGELNSFGDLWDEIWKDLLKSTSSMLIDSLSDLIGGKGPSTDAEGNTIPGTGLFTGGEMSLGQQIGTVAAGAGMVYSAATNPQLSRNEAALQGAVGGATAGVAFGGWGAVVGAVVGGLVAYFSYKDQVEPSTTIRRLGPGAAWDGSAAGIHTMDQGMSAKEERAISMALGSLYRDISGQWRDLLRGFGDAELFDLLEEMPEIIDQSFDMSAQALTQWLKEDKLPRMFQNQYTEAIKTGLRNLGMTGDAVEALWAEIRDMPGTERLAALNSVVNALRVTAEAIAMDWEAVNVEVGKTAIEQWTDGMNEAADAMDLLTAGWDDMSLVDRAADLEQIGTIFEGVTQSTINMLRQLDQIARTLDAAFETTIQGFTTRGMDEDALWSYYNERYNYYNNLLATTDDPNLILEYTQRMLGILNNASGMLTDEQWGSMAGTTGMTWQDWFLSVTQGAQTAADAAVAEQQAAIQEQYDILWNQVTTTSEQFNTLNNVVTPVVDAFIPLPPLLEDFRDGLIRLRDEMGRTKLGAIS